MNSIDHIKAGNPIRAKDHVLIPLERTSILHGTNDDSNWYHASKTLVALAVQTGAGIHVFDPKTGPIAINELKRIVSEAEIEIVLRSLE